MTKGEQGKMEVKNSKVWLKLGNIWVCDLSTKAGGGPGMGGCLKKEGTAKQV